MLEEVQAARGSARGTLDVGERVLVVSDGTAAAVGVVALIDGADHSVCRAGSTLRQAFERAGSAQSTSLPNDSDLRALLSDIRNEVGEDPLLAVALVARSGRDAKIALLGNACVFRSTAARVELIDRADTPNGDTILIRRYDITPGDVLVLLNRHAADHLRADEVRYALHPEDELDRLANWFALLAASRSQMTVTEVFIRYRESTPATASTARRRLPLLLGASLGLTVAAVLTGGIIFRVSLAGSHAYAPPRLAAPHGLRVEAVSLSSVALSWQSVPYANSYEVRLGGGRYWTSRSSLAAQHHLGAGMTYRWAVQARNGKRIGPSSPIAFLHVPLRRMPALLAVRPRGRSTSSRAGRLQFCVRTRPIGQRLDLYVTGGGKTLHRSAVVQSRSAVSELACRADTLRAGRSYAWRARASASGYTAATTNWIRFFDASPGPRGTPRPTAQPAVALATPTPTPYVPPYRPPTAVPAVPTPLPQPPTPVPTTPVTKCPNPPNCG